MEKKPRTVGFQLRLPENLKKWIEEESSRNERSLNNEIVYRLKKDYLAALDEEDKDNFLNR
ncbi:Arc family DNA-binding protein [Endozoicomonas sp. SESOKO2]|uniref:Arc family DNA-binding protein n=1 Tax=Endozoicomonas sp. SESOKO2 TaxID=2828743 RepID=UPI002147AFFC|nr:Arc family DNA-binding protein [Endozoicomonas sp. SESOKO2]